jgi:Rod binding domain-containing protein
MTTAVAAPQIAPDASTATPPSDEQKRAHQAKDAAQKFEAIFLRQMLAGLEKMNKVGGKGPGSGGSAGGIYGSMMVNSLADSISQSGGIGLSDVIMRALQGHPVTGAPKK